MLSFVEFVAFTWCFVLDLGVLVVYGCVFALWETCVVILSFWEFVYDIVFA